MGEAPRCGCKAGAGKPTRGLPRPLPCSRRGVRDWSHIPGDAPRWWGTSTGASGGAAAPRPCPLQGQSRPSAVGLPKSAWGKEGGWGPTGTGASAAGCPRVCPVCPPAAEPALGEPRLRVLPGRKFQGFGELLSFEWSQGSERSGGKAGAGTERTGKGFVVFSFPPIRSSRSGGESPAHPMGSDLPTAPACERCPMSRGGFGAVASSPTPAPSAPTPTIAAFRHGPAHFPVFLQPVPV